MYNALKTLSEMNQPIFDDCSSKYKAASAQKEADKENRNETWAKLEELARKNPLCKTVGIASPKLPTPMPEIKMKEPRANQRPSNDVDVGTGAADDVVTRRKSMLPQDPATRKALEAHQAERELSSVLK